MKNCSRRYHACVEPEEDPEIAAMEEGKEKGSGEETDDEIEEQLGRHEDSGPIRSVRFVVCVFFFPESHGPDFLDSKPR